MTITATTSPVGTHAYPTPPTAPVPSKTAPDFGR